MPSIAPLMVRRRVLQINDEGTKGTAAAGDTHVYAFDVTMNPDDTYIARKPAGHLGGNLGGIVGARTGRCQFRCELRGNGSSGLDAGVSLLLQAAGWKLATGVYTPTIVESEQKTLTIDLYEDGRMKRLTGAMGTVNISGEVGGLIYLECDFMGVWVAPTDAALGNASPATQKPMRLASSTVTFGAYTPKFSRVGVNLNPALSMRADQSKAAGYSYAMVTDIEPQADFDIEADNIATHDSFGLWLASTDANLSMLVTDGTTNATIAGAMEYRNVQTADRDGVIVDNVTCQFVGDSSGLLPTITVAAA